MNSRRIGGVLVLALALVGGGCGSGQTGSPARPAAANYDEYATAACAAWDALFKAVGNPDTGGGSVLSKGLDEAVAAADVAAADRLAIDIARELQTGREQIGIAGGWAPRRPVMVQLDRVFAAFEAMVAAKRAAARHEPNAVEPQAAFEQAGGVEAWQAMFEAARAAGGGAATDRPCPNVPVTP